MNKLASIRALLLLAILSIGVAAMPAMADDDHDQARRALEAGEVLPLRTVLELVESQFPGEVIEVELEREDGRWIYELSVLRQGGGLLKLEVDASDGKVLSVKGRDIRPAGRH